MGNLLNTFKFSSLSRNRLKDRVTSLLCKLIELRVHDPERFSSSSSADLRRVFELQEKMDFVRRSYGKWNEILSVAVDSSQPLHEFIFHVVSHMFHSTFEFSSGHLLCILTYVTDACVLKILYKKKVHVEKTVDCLISLLMEKNVNMNHLTMLLSL